MTPSTTDANICMTIKNLFQDNKITRAINLQVEFSNLAQGEPSATKYCLKLKTLFDALYDVGQAVSDQSMVPTVIKGMNPKFRALSSIIPMMQPFPTFIRTRSLLLEELKDEHRDQLFQVTTLLADSFVGCGSNSGGAPSYGAPQWRIPHAGNNGGRPTSGNTSDGHGKGKR